MKNMRGRERGFPVPAGQEESINGKGLSVLRTRSRHGERGKPLEPAHAPSLADQPSEREDRRWRRKYHEGPRLREMPEVRFREKGGKRLRKMRGHRTSHFLNSLRMIFQITFDLIWDLKI
jgi:hypothetical protein